MIRINLLPYREQLRRRQVLSLLQWFFLSLSALLVVLVAICVYAAQHRDALQGQLQAYAQESQVLKGKIGKIRDLQQLRLDVESKIQLIEQLQNGRFSSLHVFYNVSTHMPKRTWLQSARDFDQKLLLSGFAESNQAVAALMRNLDETGAYSDIHLRLIERVQWNGLDVRSFTLEAIKSAPVVDTQ